MKKILLVKFGLILAAFTFFHFVIAEKERGIVIEKTFVPGYTREIESYSILFDAPMKEIKAIPEKYTVLVRLDGKEKVIYVPGDIYTRLKKGDTLRY